MNTIEIFVIKSSPRYRQPIPAGEYLYSSFASSPELRLESEGKENVLLHVRTSLKWNPSNNSLLVSQ